MSTSAILKPGERLQSIAICLALVALVLAVLGRTLGHEFVNYDDNLYVNAQLGGLTWSGVGQAFAHGSADNWDPITTISHRLDYQCFGLNPVGHHFTNILLHAATAVMLFLVLRRMAAAIWASAFVAAAFAVHPLRVESVAWVAERKDVLCGLCFMLTLWFYGRYVSHKTCRNHLACLLFFAFGLMSKPMLVTLPFVLLLLDVWPLRRSAIYDLRSAMGRLLLEKIPFLLMSIAVCAVTLRVQLPSMHNVEAIPFPTRLGNALVSYVVYLWQLIWPVKLAVFYPYPRNGWPLWQVTGSALLLAAISAIAVAWRKKQPWLLVGWLWYLGMLVPVIGLIQVGFQAHADRYTYLPQIGLYLALTWTVRSLVEARIASLQLQPDQAAVASSSRQLESPHVVSYMLGTAAIAIVAVLSVLSFRQAGHWRNSEVLWAHALSCTTDNATAHNNLGAVLIEKGRLEEAAEHSRKALAIRPDAPGHNNLGAALLHLGQVDDAITEFHHAVALDPRYAEAHDNLGVSLSQIGQLNEAIRELQRGVELRPDNAESQYNLGVVLSLNGQFDEAAAHLQQAVTSEPRDAAAQANLAQALAKIGRPHEATAHFQKALELDPANTDTCRNFAWLLATCPDGSARNGILAVELSQKAMRQSGGKNPAFYGPLAAAYAEAGQFSNAVFTAEQALKLAVAQNNIAMVEIIEKRIQEFQSGIPVRETENSSETRRDSANPQAQ